MCGRFTNNAKTEQIEKEFAVSVDKSHSKSRYNIAPSQMIDTVLSRENERIFTRLKWGLVPHWAKDSAIGNRMINARAETLAEKPSFREAFQKRRCIIPASGFYEWQKKGTDGKQPFYFYLTEKPVFGFAGLYENWLDKQTREELETCTIITTEANEILKPVHERMPVILKADDYELWLDEKVKDEKKLEKLLVSYSAEEMKSHPVSKSVNIPDTDLKELIKPLNDF